MEIELYPVHLKIHLEPSLMLPNGKSIEDAEFYLSKSLNLSKLKKKSCHQMAVRDLKNVRLWIKRLSSEAELLEDKLDQKLGDLEIKGGDVLILERKIEGHWMLNKKSRKRIKVSFLNKLIQGNEENIQSITRPYWLEKFGKY